jgi:hypothetical protein
MNANPKPKNSSPEPPADDALARFGRLREVLIATHTEIPRLLARQRELDRELGLSENGELRQQLNETVAERENAARRRSAAIATILELGPALESERSRAAGALQAHAAEAIREFQTRYRSAVLALQTLWAEGEALSRALRSEVPVPLPVRVTTSPISGVARAQAIRADVGDVAVDPVAAKLAARLDAVVGALALCNGIRDVRVADVRHHRLALDRGTQTEFNGIYSVAMSFVCPMDGLEFPVGVLVDASLISHSGLARLMVGQHYVWPVELAVA